MRKIIISEHISLDGFAGGPNGEMDWIKIDDEIFEVVGKMTDDADTALYGRVTYEMMNGYWPTAADPPEASKHDIEHSKWYKRVQKIVLSQTMANVQRVQTTFIGNDIQQEIEKLKQQPGGNILIFGSPTAVHLLMEYRLIDEYWLFINPIILGKGIPLFTNHIPKTELRLMTTRVFACGVAGLHYTVVE